jgi:phosphate starvation-inducible protein PhoH and related proteins
MPRRKRVAQPQQVEKSHPSMITALNKEQGDYIKAILHNDLIICTGTSGSGKTAIAAGMAAWLQQNNIVENIILSRPCIGSEDLGHLPGTADEKIAPYLQPLFTELGYFTNVKAGVDNETIKIQPVSYMRGVTYKNSCIVVDECQNLCYRQLLLIVTRLGEGSKMILTGDLKQSDLGKFQYKDFAKFITKVQKIAIPTNKINVLHLQRSVRHPLVELLVETLTEGEEDGV